MKRGGKGEQRGDGTFTTVLLCSASLLEIVMVAGRFGAQGVLPATSKNPLGRERLRGADPSTRGSTKATQRVRGSDLSARRVTTKSDTRTSVRRT